MAQRSSRLVIPLLCVLLPVFLAHSEVAAPPNAFAKAAENRYLQARLDVQQHPNDPMVAWKFARACFDWAEFATTKKDRAELGQRGIEICRQLIDKDPNLAPAHYYLGLNLGQVARTKTLGALSIVRDMETAFLKAIELNPKLDHAGAHRNLGLLYRDAPGWPTSIGSRSKARFHLEQTLKLFPHYPGNCLTFLESQLEWNEKVEVRKKIPQTRKILDDARTRLTGEEWRSSWGEWQARWKTIQDQVNIPYQPIRDPDPKPDTEAPKNE